MKPGIPWSVKGIEAEAREAAKYAARRSGMTLGEWLNSVILEQADNKDDVEPRPGRRQPVSARQNLDDAGDLRQRLDHLSEQLSHLNLRDQDTATGRYLARSIQDPEADPALKSVMRRLENNEIQFTAAIDKIAERIDDLASRAEAPQPPAEDARLDELMVRMDANEQHTSHAIDRMGEELAGLARQVATQPEPKSLERPEDVPGFSSLEAALRNVVDHIEVSDKRTRDTLRTLQDRLSATHKLAQKGQSGPDQEAALDRLEKQLSQLAERMGSQERQGLNAVRQLVDEKFSRLSEQVSTVSHNADTLVERAETAAGQLAERQVQAAEQRLKTMISEATAKAAREDGGAELSRLRDDIEALGRRLEALKSETASEDEVRSLKTALEEVSNTMARGPETGPLAMLEERISALSSEIDARAGTAAEDDNLTALAQRLDELDVAVRAMGGPDAAEPGELASLKQHIAAVDERLSATEEQLSHLETIEKSIAQLFEAVESNKSSTEEIAEATARRVADEMAARGAPAGAGDAKTDSTIQALQKGLAAVKASAETADKRNNETLEAVHETLEHIISKLGEMESWHSSAAATMAREHADAEPEHENAGGNDEHADDLDEIAEPAAREDDGTPWQALMPDLGDDDSAGHAAESAGDESAEDDGDDSFMPSLPSSIDAVDDTDSAPELPAEPALSVAEDDASAKPAREDYIAAARRAALTAQPRSGLAVTGAFNLFARKKADEDTAPAATGDKTDKVAKDDNAEPKASLLSMAFYKRKAKAGNKPAATTAAATAVAATADKSAASPDEAAARRKRLILVCAVLLAAAAAYSLNARRSAQPPAEPPAKVGQLAPSQTPTKPDALVSKATANIETARAKPVANALANRTGMAPVDAIEPLSASDPLTTASLAPDASRPSTSDKEDVASRLSALVKGTAQTDAGLQPTSPTAELPDAIGTVSLRQAALNGNANAEFVIASRYLEGKGVAPDAMAAAHWYQQAAAQNLASAQYRLATLFERGLGVPKDPAAARMWYQRAAEAGNVRAMHNLAVLLAGTSNGKADYPAAAHWFASAAAYGLKDSEFNLAVLHERGLGVAIDRKEAYRLYSLAARQGDTDAGARAKTLRNYLSSAEVASIDGEVAAWTPKPVNRAANFVTIADKSWGVDMAEPDKALPPSPELTGAKLINRAQELLGKLGFDVGTPDGVMGSRTANAVRLFQMKNGLQVNGMVSNELLRHLMAQTG